MISSEFHIRARPRGCLREACGRLTQPAAARGRAANDLTGNQAITHGSRLTDIHADPFSGHKVCFIGAGSAEMAIFVSARMNTTRAGSPKVRVVSSAIGRIAGETSAWRRRQGG